MAELLTARDIMDVLGGDRAVAELTGRTYNAANNWKQFNRFPADTYLVMQCALKKRGHSAPPTLWRMVECGD